MLERIAEVQGVGLLHDAKGKSYTCQKATLIYAENARGKTTLTSVLRSASTGNVALITERKTVDGTLLPKVVLHFASGHKVCFEKGVWSERRPELLVFDADFIERNVHSGGTVSTGHRKNLLEFALGESAVAARAAVEKATSTAKTAADNVQSTVAQLSGYHSDMLLAQFEKLPQLANVDALLTVLNKQIAAASNVALILGKSMPTAVAEPAIDIDGLFAGLATSLKDVHANAEKVVRQHIAALGSKSAENWLSQGRQFDDSKNCPYCGQGTTENDLVKAYQTHFNVAYSELKAKVADIVTAAASATQLSILEGFTLGATTAAAQAASWAEHVASAPITFDEKAARGALVELQQLLRDLSRKKQSSPAEPVGTTEDKECATALWQKVLAPMRVTNLAIKVAIGTITAYKGKLAAENVQVLQQQLLKLQATKRRYEPTVVALIGQLTTKRKASEAAEKAKKTARETLDASMKATLDQYQKAINVLLKKFGASFTIKGMGANFRGSAPRSEYGLLLRGKDVSVDGGPPSFATALSEGDKRTLAFAFFVASTLTDVKLASRVVVIDDPMCSLDMNRRQNTQAVLRQIHSKAEQLIVLAHDLYFLRDLRDALLKENKAALVAVFQLARSAGDYTDFAQLDIDRECESPYFQHHRLLNAFSAGEQCDSKAVANAIRPMLEGYLHSRFPGLVTKTLLFGQVVSLIRDAKPPSPLAHARDLVDGLNEINEYAGQFHHDTNPDADKAAIVAAELMTFVKRALGIVHKGAAAP